MIWSIVEDISERKRIEKLKGEFISTISHELRTPLTSISGAIRLITGGALGDLPEKMTKMLTVAQNNTERLTHLINDLLDIEKLSANKMKFDIKPYNLITAIEDAIRDNQSYADQKEIKLKFTPDTDQIIVNVDYQRLQQVLANLISNAVKFSDNKSQVNIISRISNSMARVEVVDHGKGVPKSFYKNIFSRFSQVDSSDTKLVSGTGLGLSISRELIDRMNGKIGFESIEGKGSTFYFELPVNQK